MIHFALFILAVFFAPFIFHVLVGWSIAVIISHFWQYLVALVLIIFFIVFLLVGVIWAYVNYEGFLALALVVIPITIIVLTIKHDKHIAKKEAKAIAERLEIVASQEAIDLETIATQKAIEIEKRARMTQEELTIEFKDYVLDLSDDYWVNNYEEYAKWYKEMMKRKSDRRNKQRRAESP